MEKFIISLLLIIGSLTDVYAQITYQKQFFSLQGGKPVSGFAYSGLYDTSVLLVTNNYIMRFDKNTCAMHSCKSVSLVDSSLLIAVACQKGDALYIRGLVYYDTTMIRKECLLKYSLSSNTLLWQKIIDTDSGMLELSGITVDSSNNLYITGTLYDTSGAIDLMIMKVDTGGSVIWARRIGNPSVNEYPSAIVYKNDTDIYMVAIAYSGIWGRAVTFRMDHAGNIINHNAIMATSGPRLGSGAARMMDNGLCVVLRTVVGPSDPGPTLIRIVTPTLSVVQSKTISGIDLGGVFSNGKTMLMTGQALITSGQPGFKSVRVDTGLNITAARHFKEIPTISIASSEMCFIDDSNGSFHFFQHGSYDSLYVIKASPDEVGCNDVAFSPPISTLGYVDTSYVYTSSPLLINQYSISASVSDAAISSVDKCDVSSISIPEKEQSTLFIYPNPAHDIINIFQNEKGYPIVEIRDLLGRTLITTNSKDVIDVSALAKGVYIIKVKMGNAIFIRQFIKD